MSNQKLSFSLSLGKYSFHFNSKELVKSSWQKKKKTPSQQKREDNRKLDRHEKKGAEKVTPSEGFSKAS